MEKIFIIILSLFIMSCKNANNTNGAHLQLADLSVYAENKFNQGVTSKFHNNVLHAIYLHQMADNNLYTFQVLSEIPYFEKDNVDLRNRYTRLLITSSDGDQLHYIPVGTNKENIINNLNLKKENGKKFVWVKSHFAAGEIAILAITNGKEILLNERNFEIKILDLNDVDEVKLNKLSQFQKINIESKIKISNPDWAEVVHGKRESTICDKGDMKVACRCFYAINVPTNNYQKFSFNKELRIFSDIKINEKVMAQEGDVLNFDLSNEKGPIELNLNFKKYLESKVTMSGRPVNNQCFEAHAEEVVEQKKLNYDVKIKVIGTNKLEEELGELDFDLDK